MCPPVSAFTQAACGLLLHVCLLHQALPACRSPTFNLLGCWVTSHCPFAHCDPGSTPRMPYACGPAAPVPAAASFPAAGVCTDTQGGRAAACEMCPQGLTTLQEGSDKCLPAPKPDTSRTGKPVDVYAPQVTKHDQNDSMTWPLFVLIYATNGRRLVQLNTDILWTMFLVNTTLRECSSRIADMHASNKHCVSTKQVQAIHD
jgi:hypothetical protein